jgi:glycosyltransferase involved in cell wall biosynthesis
MKKPLKKPKIAIIHPAVGSSSGGSQTFVLELAEKLKENCDITILSKEKANELCKPINCLARRNTETYNFFWKIFYGIIKNYSSSPDIIIEHITSFFPVLYELLSNNYDFIYPNNDWGGLLVAAIARKIKGTPIIFTEHCGFMENGKIASRNLKFRPDKYIVLTEEMKEFARKISKNTDIEYIPNGVNLERFNPQIEAVNIDLPRPLFLTTGRNYANKRLHLAIEAVARLKRGSLLILTPETDKKALEALGNNLLGQERFKCISVPYNKIAGYYRTCDVFTLPSKNEPFGLVYLEAMACNKPVVAPLDNSREKIIGKAGKLCYVENIDEYAVSLNLAAKKSYGNTPFKQACKFSLNLTADMYLKQLQNFKV